MRTGASDKSFHILVTQMKFSEQPQPDDEYMQYDSGIVMQYRDAFRF